MGRKTWDSIPTKFRPLKGRLNVVISRAFTAPPQDPANPGADPVQAGSLEQAVAYLRSRPAGSLGRVFVIGGAQIYGAALALPETRRILLTRVLSDFACDTHFSLALGAEGDGGAPGWRRDSQEERDGWVGETVPDGLQEESGTAYEFQMWERVD